MLDNQTRRELLSKARQSGFPGSILDVFSAYEQGKDIIGEYQQQQQQQQGQQMSDMAAQQAGMMPPGQQPLPQEMPQAPAGPPPGLQGQSLPSPPPPSNPNLVDSTQQQPVGMSTNAKGSSGGQVLMATGGFVEKFTEDQYNKFSTHFPFSKEQRGSIAHRATVEHPDLTMVNPKKYVFGGLKYALGGKEDPPEMPFGLPLKEQNIYTLPEYNQPRNPKTGEILPDPQRPSLGMGTGASEYKMTAGFEEGDVDIPTIVAGQYIGERGAEDRYRLTGERFKTMTDPGAYSKFYEQTGRLGLMQEKRKGGFKYENGGPGDPPYIPFGGANVNNAPYVIPTEPYREPNIVTTDAGGRERYDPVSENIYIKPNYDDFLDHADAVDHEKMHHLQNMYGRLSYTDKWPGPLKKPAIVSSRDKVFDYYNRNREDLNTIVNSVPKSTLTGIPQDILLRGFQKNLYTTPGTAEYEADNTDETFGKMEKEGIKFATGGLEGDPKKKGDIATAADSSFVANKSMDAHNFYIHNNYIIDEIKPVSNSIFNRLKEKREEYNTSPTYNSVRGKTNDMIPYEEYTNYKAGQHRFGQKEFATGVMNRDAPMSYYDDRILPQNMVGYFAGANSPGGDYANVPTYDKLAVTPWGKLSKSQKLERIKKFGSSGTPFEGQSTKEALENFKNPVPQPKMKEPGLLPVPKIDLQLQLQNIQSPYQPVDRGEYFIKPSGNPGVGVIHYKKDNGDGTYTTKVIGPSLARDWYNDADQKIFDDKDPNTRVGGRVDYDPRDTDQKIYRDMHDAVMELQKNNSSVQDSAQERLRLRKENEAKQGAIKFATGGKKLFKRK
jgi:hypothetical protein